MQELITQLLSNYPLLAPLIFILIRISSVVFPPIPGVAIDIPVQKLHLWESKLGEFIMG